MSIYLCKCYPMIFLTQRPLSQNVFMQPRSSYVIHMQWIRTLYQLFIAIRPSVTLLSVYAIIIILFSLMSLFEMVYFHIISNNILTQSHYRAKYFIIIIISFLLCHLHALFTVTNPSVTLLSRAHQYPIIFWHNYHQTKYYTSSYISHCLQC